MITINLNFNKDKPELKVKAKQLVPVDEDNNLGIIAEVNLSSEDKSVNVSVVQPEQDSKLLALLGAEPLLETKKDKKE